MPNYVIKLGNMQLMETGAANEKSTSNVVIVTLLYPNYSKTEYTATMSVPIKENLELNATDAWNHKVRQIPTHNWLYKGKLEGEGVIKIQVINAKKPSIADKIAAKIVESAIDSAASVIPLPSLLKDAVESGLDELEFQPKDSKYIIAEGVVQFCCNDITGEVTLSDIDNHPVNQIRLKSPATISVPQRKTERGEFNGWEKIVLIEKDSDNGFLMLDMKHFS